jgi:beta-galactosidase
MMIMRACVLVAGLALCAADACAQGVPSTNAVRFYLPGEHATQPSADGASSARENASRYDVSVSPPATVSLDGHWDFYYDGVTEAKKRNVSYAMKEPVPELPTAESYETTILVPAYWDDHLSNLQGTSWWFWAQFNSNWRKIDFPMGNKWVPPFGNLPYLVGTGYYRKFLFIPEDWESRKVMLSVGGVVAEAKIFVNGTRVGEKADYLTPGDFDLSGQIRAGKNELIIAVTNRDTFARGAPTSCAIDVFHGFTGGIYGPVTLTIASAPRIADLYVYPASSKLRWRAEIHGGGSVAAGSTLHWSVLDPAENDREIAKGQVELSKEGTIEWESDASSLEKWTERTPKLYTLQVKSMTGREVRDQRRQRFGLRTLTTRDHSVLMNDKSLMLRGICDSWYYPQTTTAPMGKAAYVDIIRKYQQLGFNWIRFHTAMPRQEYLEAADELGMLIQVESPRGSDEQTWISILKAARNHPSVILYCVSNEALMDEKEIAGVIKRHALTRQHVPDALFSPMQALRGVEYGAGRDDFGPDALDAPFLHNPRRLAMLKPVADVFQPTGWSHFSFNSAATTKPSEINAKLKLFERPLMLHEVGIHGSYLDLSLTERYRRSRIGTDLFVSVRDYLDENGLLPKADIYYRNSCRWAQLLRKHALERARLCETVKGYDLLGAVDIHWMFMGYTCGVMNEFLELKPGESVQDVVNYNGESVLLTDLDTDRVLFALEKFKTRLLASLFGDESLKSGTVFWNVKDDAGKVYASNSSVIDRLPNGAISELTEIQFQLPRVAKGMRLHITAKLLDANYDLQNQWAIWVFPQTDFSTLKFSMEEQTAARLKVLDGRKPAAERSRNAVYITSSLSPETVEFMKTGGRELLLGPGPFPNSPMSFQVAAAGRVIGNQATIITNHPVFDGFPHDGYCDWQFYQLLSNAAAVVFEDSAVPFDPILEVASSYKLIKKQAAIFELAVGDGALLVCSLNVNGDDPAARHLLSNLIKYACGDGFKPKHAVDPQVLTRSRKAE